MRGVAPPRSRIIAAFAAIYVIWGSTYLAIRIAVETLPPFLMAGARFTIAGAMLYFWSRARSRESATPAQWRNAAVIGGLLLLCGNGGVVWAEQFVPSGLTALIVAVLPFWMVLVEWLRPRGRRPTVKVVAGLVIGFIGLVVLIGPGIFELSIRMQPAAAATSVPLIGAVVLVLASFAWALGSIYSRHVSVPRAADLATGMQMLCGGALLLTFSVLRREPWQLDPALVSGRSIAAFFYLLTFGSLIGYTAYIWLLQVAPPARVATYAYVNPVVAVLLGWGFAGETLTPRTGIAAAIIVGAVALITTARSSELPREAA